MTKHRHLLASAPLALMAIAALPATPAFAQETPTIVLDVPTTSPAPTPSAATLPAPTVTQPIVLPAEEPVATTAAEATPAQIERTASRSIARTTRPTASAPAAAPREAAPVTATPVAAPPPAAALPQTAATAASAAPIDLPPPPAPVNDNSLVAMIMSLLAMGAIGLAALLLFRSQRRRVKTVPTMPPPITPATPVAPLANETPLAPTPVARPAMMSEPIGAAYQAPAGAAVALPAEAPQSEAERGRLLERMVAARPDRANPFHSHKARAKRARLILQSIGTRFTDRKPGIDLSQYTNVWPELRGWRPATA